MGVVRFICCIYRNDETGEEARVCRQADEMCDETLPGGFTLVDSFVVNDCDECFGCIDGTDG